MIYLKKKCAYLNKELFLNKLSKNSWGNVSIKDKKKNIIFIKPSGGNLHNISHLNISCISIKKNKLISGLRPSVDLPIHFEMYKSFVNIKSIIHTHSTFLTAWAQSNQSIPNLGTTHADMFKGNIPITRTLKLSELKDYEKNIGKVIVEFYKKKKINPLYCPVILIPFHGAIVLSDSSDDIVEKAIAAEEIAKLAFLTLQLNKKMVIPINVKKMFLKHYERKNGKKKYYGQK